MSQMIYLILSLVLLLSGCCCKDYYMFPGKTQQDIKQEMMGEEQRELNKQALEINKEQLEISKQQLKMMRENK